MESFPLLTLRGDILTWRIHFLLFRQNSFDTIKHIFQTSESPKSKRSWNTLKKWAQTHVVNSFKVTEQKHILPSPIYKLHFYTVSFYIQPSKRNTPVYSLEYEIQSSSKSCIFLTSIFFPISEQIPGIMHTLWLFSLLLYHCDFP